MSERREILEWYYKWLPGYFLEVRGEFIEAMQLSEELLAHAPLDSLRREMLQRLGLGACYSGRYAEAQRFMEQALLVADRVGELNRAWVLKDLAFVLALVFVSASRSRWIAKSSDQGRDLAIPAKQVAQTKIMAELSETLGVADSHSPQS